MSYSHKSGCQKRKERAEREEKFFKLQKVQSTLTAFKFCAKEKPTQSIETKNQILSNDSENKKITLTNDNNVTNDLTENLVNPVLNDSIEKNHAVEKSDTVVVDYSSALECLSEKSDNIICPEKQSNFQSLSNTYLYNYDIGTLKTEIIQTQLIEKIIRQGHEKIPAYFPRDRLNEPFPLSLLSKSLPNGEKVKRDWLVWSRIKNAFYCFPCRLFKTSTLNCSFLSSLDG